MRNSIYIIILLIVVGASSCKKDDGPYFVTKEITVAALLDSGGKIPFAEFALFDTHDDWRKDSNAIVRARTDKDGLFIYQDDNFIYGKKYYFDLNLDLLNNWKKEINGKESDESFSFHFPNEPKRIRKDITIGLQTGAVISETYHDIFVGDSLSTTWNLYQLTINGVIQDWNTIDSCLKDNQLIFYKDFEMVISEGKNVCAGKKLLIYSEYLPATTDNLSIGIKSWPEFSDHYGDAYLVQNLSEIIVEMDFNGTRYMYFYRKDPAAGFVY